jgi:hypothetical protein
MRKFNSPVKNALYFVYRWVAAFIDPIRFFNALKGIFWYTRDYIVFSRQKADLPISFADSYPVLHDKVDVAPFDSHYFYQNVWMFRRIIASPATEHFDVGSGLDFVSLLSTIKKVNFIDIRPIITDLPNFTCIKGSILELPFAEKSLDSLSCLHVVEHIGLGRYGDPVNPFGTIEALKELQRVLSQTGTLFFATPVGKPRVCFNAHRVHDPHQIIGYFDQLKLAEFAYIDDAGKLHENASPDDARDQNYACGLFIFRRS